ncbi:MAG: aldo/keto reductase [Sphaerochaeta sp.]|jgi:aryl-alcohol dehydrogenase-like predicted oxidoreductase|nr:aldo/keto reductase [Sphaerochaeta sp.]MCI2077079.1 aldo/keto reductase [Sphaerochaeta sp.]MCI2103836.1 aldo/keto reductase [Sphaerochaeta sp.]
MQYVDFHGRKLSVIALGCDHYGETVTTENSIANLNLYVERGGNILDTARVYGQEKPLEKSTSETLLGRWMEETKNRDKVFLITKGCHPLKEDTHHSRVDRTNLAADIQESLEELRTDHVDLWFYHRDRPEIPADELIDMANDEVYDKGYATFLGASNWTSERIQKANDWAKAHGKQGFSMSEIQASLAHCDATWWGDDTIQFLTKEEEAWYAKSGMPVLGFASQAKGIFSKLLSGQEDKISARARERFLSPENLALVPKVKKLCEKYDASPAAVTLAYLLSKPVRVIPLVGCSNPVQLADSLSQPDLRLTEAEMADLSH